MTEMDTLLTTRQLQALLQVDRITIYRMLNDGRLRGFKVGGQWRFSRQAIEHWLREQQASLGVPAAPERTADVQPSPEALPLSCIQAIQEIFAEALGVGAVTTAVSGRPLTPVANCCSFCNLILSTEVGRQRCIASWQAAAAETGDHPPARPELVRSEAWEPSVGTSRGGLPPRPATCHAGLRYVWGRIEVQGQMVAATHAGQFLDAQPDGETWSVAIQILCAATGIDEQRLRRSLATVPILDGDRQEQVSHLLQRVAATFAEIGEERLDLLGRLQRIAEISSTSQDTSKETDR